MADKALERKRARRRKLRAQSLCTMCGKYKAMADMRRCFACGDRLYVKNKARSRDKFDRGECRRCPSPRVENRKHCKACLAKAKANVNDFRKKKYELRGGSKQ